MFFGKRTVLCLILSCILLGSLLCPSALADGGWKTFGADGWAYQKDDGSWAYGWQEIGGSWYYFGDDGWMVTGWRQIHGSWYFFYENGVMASDTMIGNDYVNLDGVWIPGSWISLEDGEWTYQYGNGSLASGWLNLNAVWYYFDESGRMITGWLNDSGTWYYLNSDGAMVTGWYNIEDTWYFFYDDGAMAHDTVIDGYTLDSSGAWVQTDETETDTQDENQTTLPTADEIKALLDSLNIDNTSTIDGFDPNALFDENGEIKLPENISLDELQSLLDSWRTQESSSSTGNSDTSNPDLSILEGLFKP